MKMAQTKIKNHRVHTSVPTVVKTKIRSAAKDKGLTESAWLRMRLIEWFDNEEVFMDAWKIINNPPKLTQLGNLERLSGSQVYHPSKRDLEVSEDKTSPVYCEHANENPAVCPCPGDCYCKTRTCRNRR